LTKQKRREQIERRRPAVEPNLIADAKVRSSGQEQSVRGLLKRVLKPRR